MDETPDINELIRELNEDGLPVDADRSSRPKTVRSLPIRSSSAVRDSSELAVRLDAWLQELVRRAGSDLLLVAGRRLGAHRWTGIASARGRPLSGEEIEDAVVPALPPSRPSALSRRRNRRRLAPGARAGPFPGQPPPRARPRRRGRPRAAGQPAAPRLARPPRRGGGADAPSPRPRARRRARRAPERRPRSPRSSRRSTGATRATSSRSRIPIEYEHPHRNCLVEQVEIGDRRAGLSDGAARRDAPGAGRDRRRRDAGPGDHAHRARGRRDGPPRASRPCTRPTSPRPSRASPTRFRRSGRTRSARSSPWRSPRC